MPLAIHGRNQVAGLCLLCLSCLLFIGLGFAHERRALNSFDFKPIYGASRCLAYNCNPYDEQQIRAQYVAGGGDPADTRPFRPFNSNYPPSSLFFIIPIAVLPWKAAHYLWLSLTAIGFCAAAFATARLSAPYSPLLSIACLSLLVVTSTILMLLAQPAALAIALCVIAVYLLLENKYPALAVILFALSLVLKPHTAALIWLYFLIANRTYRIRALQIAALTIALCIPGIVLASMHPASAHWFSDLRANLAGITSSGNSQASPGAANSEVTSIASLNAVFAAIRDNPRFYNPATWLVSAAWLAAWIYAVLRVPPSRARGYLALAAIACFSLLPIYHRQYDTRILLLAIPALALLIANRKAVAPVIFTVAAILITSTNFGHAWGDTLGPRIFPTPSIFESIIFFRYLPITMFLLATFYLFHLYRQAGRAHALHDGQSRQSIR